MYFAKTSTCHTHEWQMTRHWSTSPSVNCSPRASYREMWLQSPAQLLQLQNQASSPLLRQPTRGHQTGPSRQELRPRPPCSGSSRHSPAWEPQQKLPGLARRRPSETDRQAVRTSRILALRARSSGRSQQAGLSHHPSPPRGDPLSTADWHLPSASTSTKPHAAGFQRPERSGWRAEMRHHVLGETGQNRPSGLRYCQDPIIRA